MSFYEDWVWVWSKFNRNRRIYSWRKWARYSDMFRNVRWKHTKTFSFSFHFQLQNCVINQNNEMVIRMSSNSTLTTWSTRKSQRPSYTSSCIVNNGSRNTIPSISTIKSSTWRYTKWRGMQKRISNSLITMRVIFRRARDIIWVLMWHTWSMNGIGIPQAIMEPW